MFVRVREKPSGSGMVSDIRQSKAPVLRAAIRMSGRSRQGSLYLGIPMR